MSHESTTRLSLIIPCFNEAGNLSRLVERGKFALASHPGLEIIFVDNGSTDNTNDQLRDLAEGVDRMIIHDIDINRGYGFGIKSGLAIAKGELLGWTHADLQTDPFDAIRALELVPSRGSKVILKGTRTGRSFSDSLFTNGMSIFESILFRASLWDINAQPTIFSRDLNEVLLCGPDDFSLDLFALVSAKRLDFQEIRFPVIFGPRFSGESKWNNSASARWKFIKRTLKFSVHLARKR